MERKDPDRDARRGSGLGAFDRFSLLGNESNRTPAPSGLEPAARALFDHAPLGVAIVDAGGRIAECNARLRDWIGADGDRPIGAVFHELAHPEDRRAIAAHFADTLHGKAGRTTREMRCLRHDGSVFWTRVTAARLSDAADRPVALIAMLEDIGDLKESEQKLYMAQRWDSMGQLASGAAHDLSNLLMIVLGYNQLMLEQLTEKDEVLDCVVEANAAAERAVILTKQLLAFTKSRSARPQRLDVSALLERVSGLLRRLIPENIRIDVHTTSDPTTVLADPEQLEQVLVNVVLNARDAMTDGGTLAIRTNNVQLGLDDRPEVSRPEPSPFVLLTVQDTGPGIDLETQRRIFEPFFSTKDERLGLGLTISQAIVTQLGGSLQVQSEPGRGSTFSVYLPRVGGPPPVEADSPLPKKKSPDNATVLLVEDEEMVRAVVLESLEQAGYHVLSAASSDEALELSRQFAHKIDLLVTDVILPKMNGRQLASRLTLERPAMKVLYMTGHVDQAISQRGVSLEDPYLLRKPFTPSVLIAKIADVLSEEPPG